MFERMQEGMTKAMKGWQVQTVQGGGEGHL
ncbi:hypothetical protein GGR09_001627 [Bartonella heixiaziensis]